MQVTVYQQLILLDGQKKQRSIRAMITGSLYNTCTKRFDDVRSEVKELSIKEGLVRRAQVSYDRTLICIDGGKK